MTKLPIGANRLDHLSSRLRACVGGLGDYVDIHCSARIPVRSESVCAYKKELNPLVG